MLHWKDFVLFLNSFTLTISIITHLISSPPSIKRCNKTKSIDIKWGLISQEWLRWALLKVADGDGEYISGTIGNWSMFLENNILKLWKMLGIIEYWIDWSQGKTNICLTVVFVGKTKMLCRGYFCKIKMCLWRKSTIGMGKSSISFKNIGHKRSRLEHEMIY